VNGSPPNIHIHRAAEAHRPVDPGMPCLRAFVLASGVAAAAVVVLGCGRVVPPPSPAPSALPPPRAGSQACPPTAAEASLVRRLADGAITVTAVTASTDTALFPEAVGVCLMDVGGTSFQVAFFSDAAAASVVSVCESRSGTRYLYQVNGRTIDAAYQLFWSVSGALLAWTNSAGLDASLRKVLNGARPPC
jgi:hypothetical protein